VQPDNEPRTAGVPEASPRRGIGKRNLLVLLLFGALLLVGGATIAGAVWYDRQTAPDRSSPDVAADNYLRALLVERDETRVGLWACGDRSALAEMEAYRTEIVQREEQLHTSISVSWGPLTVNDRSDRSARVVVDIRRSASVDGTLQSVSDTWQLLTTNDDGWRVCAAEKQPT